MVEQGLENGLLMRDDRWSEAIAVGNFAFVESVKNQLAVKASYRGVVEADSAFVLRESSQSYNNDFARKMEPLSVENTHLWDENPVGGRG